MIGKTISHYKILEKLGGGGMGIVYKATDLKLDRTVALKFLPPELLRDQNAKKRFLREAQTASSLQHDNTCVIHDIEETDDGQIFISMEYYKGETLKKKIERDPLRIEKVIKYTIQIGNGLANAHDSAMVHRDIKPANIMITENDEVKIVDFGLAHLIGHSKITRDGSTPGTVDYMSPEQTGGEKVDHRTDIWSLGVVLYEMCTGERPFKGDYDQAVMYSILNEVPDPPSSIRSDIPLELDKTVRMALEKEPEKRYKNVNDMLLDLRKSVGDMRESKLFLLRRYFRRKQWVILGVILLLIVSMLFIDLFIPGFGVIDETATRLDLTKNSIAVMICENRVDPEDKDRMGEIITDALITDLMESHFVNVVSLQRLYDILKHMGKQGQKVIDKSEQLDIAKHAGVSLIISSSIVKIRDQYLLTAQCIEVQNGNMINSIEIPGSKESIHLMVDSISTHIKRHFGLPEEKPEEQDRSLKNVTTISTNAYRHYLAGEELAAKYDMKEAVLEYKKAIAFDTTFATAYSRLAAVYRFLRQKENTEYAISKAFRHIDHIKNRERYQIQYQRALEEKNINLAKKTLLQWVERYSDDKLARYYLGLLYTDHFQMYDEAIFQFNRAIKLDHDYRLAYNYLGYAYAHKGMREKALEAFDTYLSLSPDEVNPYDSLAEIYMNLIGDYDIAELYFTTAIQINPDFAPHKLAELFQLKGQYKKAETLLLENLSKETLLATGIKYFLLARLHSDMGDYDRAINLIEIGKKLLPSYKNFYWLSGFTYLKLNKVQQAQADLAHLQKIDPEGKNTFHLSGLIHLEKGNYEAAFRDLQKSVQMTHFISWNYYEHREFYRYTLAEASLIKGDIDKAIKECTEIVTDNPNWARAYFLLGRIYEQSKKHDKAVNAYNAFLKTWKDADSDLTDIIYARQRLERLR